MEGLFSSWVAAITRPSVETFDAQKPLANRNKTLISVILAAVVSAVLGAILVLVAATAASIFSGFGLPLFVGPIAAARAFISSLVNTIVFFYVFIYVLQFVAKQFGGTGNFDEQAHLVAIAYAPIVIISSIVMFIPFLGQIIAFLLFIYLLVLLTFATRSGQGIQTWPAVVSWVISGIAAAIVIGIISAITGGWL